MPAVTSDIEYHLSELDTALSPASENHNLPNLRADDRDVLDVGCGIGQTLVGLHTNPDGTKRLPNGTLAGVDVDADSVNYGQEKFKYLNLTCSPAESLPFKDGSFDFVYSRVSLQHTDIPASINEIFRVTRPGGHLWISMHPQRNTWKQLVDSMRTGKIKDGVYRWYVLLNGLSLNVFGKVFPAPILRTFNAGRKRRVYESFQSEKSMRRLLTDAGYTDIQFKQDRHFVVTANKP